MHRFTVSLLAFLGALTSLRGHGRAEPREAKPPALAESVAAKDEGAAAAKREAPGAVKPGESLKKASETAARAEESPKKSAAAGKGALGAKRAPAWTRVKPGVVKLVRGSETLEVRVLDRKQRLVAATLPQFARFLRAKSGADHPIDRRLVTLLAALSDHFGGREVNVVSGFRPYSPGQYSHRSNHNEGRAIDFSITGIANETVRDFCRTFRNVGVGYYPNSLFVHLDVRDGNAYWVDYAAPGQAPRYRPGETKDDDDEGDGIASVDGGASMPERSSDSPGEDVARGRSSGRGGNDRGEVTRR